MANELSDNKKTVRVSVRTLVEFIFRSGDLDSRVRAVPDAEAMLMGSRIHRAIQGRQRGDYQAEVPLKEAVEYDDLILKIEGRADGIFTDGSLTVIDEIKGVMRNVNEMEEPVPVHLAQARMYGAIYTAQNGLEEIGVRMTYADLDTEDIHYFNFCYTAEENAAWFRDAADAYHKWLSLREAQIIERDASMEELTFPFPYREGQKKLVASVYKAISEEKQLFIEAPTGVGKTMAVLYPAIRSLREGRAERLFYLTAKAVTRAVPSEALRILADKGLKIRYAVMMAKEKICPMSEVACNPDDCPYAKGHFDRVNDAAFKLLTNETVFDAETILKAAEESKVCPYELMLDVAVWCDAVICDYNYAFDPNVRLKRFFGEGTKNEALILIDEAHNLVERGRTMFSAQLFKADVLAARKKVKERAPKVYKELTRLNTKLLSLKHVCEEAPDGFHIMESDEGIDVLLLRVTGALQEFFEKSRDHQLFEELSDFYFTLRDMTAARERFNEHYIMYAEVAKAEEAALSDGAKEDLVVRVSCLNPAGDLQEVMDRAVSTVLFSATLLPIEHYRGLLSGRDDDMAVYAESPFPRERRKILLGRRVSTVYKARGPAMYDRIASYIHDTVTAKRGNYMAFFPSYKVMDEVLKIYRDKYDEPDVNWVVQSRGMYEDDREIFLENFYEDPRMSLVGFCVMGGIFAEGIDLIGSKLIGAIVVGTGLPQISGEGEILRRYYEGQGLDGFGHAYRIPGMNKVLQAAGRVIRTAEDRGVIVLLDDRFFGRDYQKLFPREWSDREIVSLEGGGEPKMKEVLEAFWKDL